MPTPDRTSFTEIVEAGREVLEADGLSRLTMQSVAERVGVRDRDALVAAVIAATMDDLTDRLEASDRSIEGLSRAYRAFAHGRPEGFRLIFSAAAPQAGLARASAVILDSVRAVVGDAQALEAARLVTAWATGFVQMELAGAFRLGGDLDEAFTFGISALRRGLEATSSPSGR